MEQCFFGKKSAKHTFLKRCFGFLGKISANSLIANKKLFRTCTVTLCLCMVLMFSFLAVFSVSDVNNTKAEHDNPFDINITLESGHADRTGAYSEIKRSSRRERTDNLYDGNVCKLAFGARIV